LNESKFISDSNNPFQELSELRFEVAHNDRDFDLNCRLIFGKMRYEHRGRQYEIGLHRAHLRLNLEGCETTLDPAYGEVDLPTLVEEEAVTDSSKLVGGIGFGSSIDEINLNGHFEFEKGRVSQKSKSRKHERLPMARKPGDSWEIVMHTISSEKADIDGTAMSGQKLCTIRRKEGGNRFAVIGEVQVSRSEITVSAAEGNKVGKKLTEWNNKDAIIAQILERALRREAVGGAARCSQKILVVSRAEVAEE
jgi:hypothetical protein